MGMPKKYYEELYFNCYDDRQLTSRNQDAIIELLDKNGAVGVVGMYDEPGYPIYFISGFALTATGLSYSEFIDISEGKFINLVYYRDRKTFEDNVKNRNLDCHEFRMVDKDGNTVWVNSYQKSSVSIDNKPIIVASVRVIDDTRKRESELLDALTRGYNRIIYVDVNQGRYRIIKSEENCYDEQVCGTLAELETMLHDYGRDFINPEDHSFADMLNKLNFFSNPGEKGGNYQATYRAKVNGEYQWVQFQAYYGGKMNLDTGHIILTFRVVDKEKKQELETNRILSDSLAMAEEADHVKNKFLSRMSHDLRTPLNGIIGMLEIARQNRLDPEKIDECIEKISDSCDNLLSLVQDVLDMNSLESGKVELMEESLNLQEFLKGEIASIAQRAADGGLVFDIRIEDFEHPDVIGSPKHIMRIFEHIIDNAIKYNKPNGSITLIGREQSSSEHMAVYEFTVEDTGLGMQPEFLKKVFEMFEQENNEARTKYMGTGLGMSIVKKLVDQMNGAITVESTLDVGTKIVFSLPLKITAPAVVSEDAEIDLTGRRVLLVEDNEVNMEIAQFLLESAGMVVTCAVNGQDAIDKYMQTEVGELDVILMDIMMPVMDGLESAKHIRRAERPDALTIPIIALSANVMDSDIKKSKMAGMDEHLAKPVNANQLLGSIAKCLKH